MNVRKLTALSLSWFGLSAALASACSDHSLGTPSLGSSAGNAAAGQNGAPSGGFAATSGASGSSQSGSSSGAASGGVANSGGVASVAEGGALAAGGSGTSPGAAGSSAGSPGMGGVPAFGGTSATASGGVLGAGRGGASAGASSKSSSGGASAGTGAGGADGCNLPALVGFKADVQPFLIKACGGGSGCHVVDTSNNHAYDWITDFAHCPNNVKRFEVVLALVTSAHPSSCPSARYMPPPDATGSGLRAPLTACEIATLSAWIGEPLVTQMHNRNGMTYPMPPYN